MLWYVIDDDKTTGREAFVKCEEEANECLNNYSGYYVLREFNTQAEAEKFCTEYNNYVGIPDVELGCCSEGCKMCAAEYDRWNGLCAYKGT